MNGLHELDVECDQSTISLRCVQKNLMRMALDGHLNYNK